MAKAKFTAQQEKWSVGRALIRNTSGSPRESDGWQRGPVARPNSDPLYSCNTTPHTAKIVSISPPTFTSISAASPMRAYLEVMRSNKLGYAKGYLVNVKANFTLLNPIMKIIRKFHGPRPTSPTPIGRSSNRCCFPNCPGAPTGVDVPGATRRRC